MLSFTSGFGDDGKSFGQHKKHDFLSKVTADSKSGISESTTKQLQPVWETSFCWVFSSFVFFATRIHLQLPRGKKLSKQPRLHQPMKSKKSNQIRKWFAWTGILYQNDPKWAFWYSGWWNTVDASFEIRQLHQLRLLVCFPIISRFWEQESKSWGHESKKWIHQKTVILWAT